MEAIKLLSYKNWSIKIECHECDSDPHQTMYASSAIVTFVRPKPPNGARPSECFVAQLPGKTFLSSHEANLAVQREAKRRIDELPVQLAANLASRI